MLAGPQILPDRSPVLYQNWSELLFLHWRVPAEVIQVTLPPALKVDTFEGKAYLGIVPFLMSGIRPRFFPAVPGLSAFPELNLRTYVRDSSGQSGVWFYSLDADQRLAVSIGRHIFSLPYVKASMEIQKQKESWIHFTSQRPKHAIQEFRYRPATKPKPAEPDTLEHFLVERYHLFSYRPRRKQLYLGQVYHRPYAIAEAEVTSYNSDLFALNQFTNPNRKPDHAHYAPGVQVSIYPLRLR